MSDPVSRLNAALTGRYRIERELGEGGMATVYLADDLKHERKVALKVLKPELAAVVGAERFLAEIKTTANLQHPHILPLFDSGEADSFLYYVMPYVEGETLRTRVEREKQLGVDDALAVTKKVASALDYAHGNGVVHRDIKPANILLSSRGEPLVADFGIALVVAQAGAGRITETGLSLGTPHYMSPEQATGDRDIDPRSDVYALACVLYEMLAGQPPFTASTAQAILVQILTADPASVTSLRRTVPPHIDAVLTRALEKLPADRFGSAAEFARALDDPGFTYSARPAATGQVGATPVAAVPTRSWIRDPRSIAALVAAAVLGGTVLFKPAPQPVPGVPTTAEVTGLDIQAGAGFGGRRLAISPDGRWIAAGAVEDGTPHLFVRPARDPAWRRLPNTENATTPAFSRDGQSVAFSVGPDLFSVPLTGGPAFPVASPGANPHWTADGTIVYDDGGAIYGVPAAGGTPELLFVSDTIYASRPHMLPNGRGVLFGEFTPPNPTRSRVLLFELETGELRVLASSGNQPRYVPTGHVVYGHGDQVLMAVPFDLETLATTGDPVTLLPSLTVDFSGGSQFDVSETGTLIYDGGGLGLVESTFVEVALDGTETRLPIPAGSSEAGPRYSPDGSQIAYEDDAAIRVYDAASGASPQVTSDRSFYPVWSPGGEYLYFSFGPRPDADGARARADGSDQQTRLFERESGQYIQDVSAGDSILLVRETAGGDHDLLLLRLDGNEPRWENYLTAQWNETSADLSPDGEWVVYMSDEAGEQRIYAHRFPVVTGQQTVSPGVGTSPVWSPDGRTIYYVAGTTFMAVDVTTEPVFSVSAPRELFDQPAYRTSLGEEDRYRNYDIHPDGDRFLLVRGTTPAGDGQSSILLSDVYLVTDWFEELKARMGGS